MIEPPERTPYRGHACRCSLGPGDLCGSVIHNPDQPICDWCEDAGHPQRIARRSSDPRRLEFGPLDR